MSTALLLPTDPTVTPVRPLGPVAYTRKGAHMRVTKAPVVTFPRHVERRTALVIWATAALAGVLLGFITDSPPAPPDRAPVVAGPTRLDLDLDEPGGEGLHNTIAAAPGTTAAPVADHDPTTTTRPSRDRDPRPAAPAAGPAASTTTSTTTPATPTSSTTSSTAPPSTTTSTTTAPPPSTTSSTTAAPPTTAEPHLDPAPNPG